MWPSETQSSSGDTRQKWTGNSVWLTRVVSKCWSRRKTCSHPLAAILEYWTWSCSAQTLTLYPHRLEDKNHGSSVGLLCRELGARSQGFQSKQPRIAAPHHCLFIPLHPTWQKEGETQTNRERKGLLAVNPGLAGFSWTAVSNKVSRLKKKKNGVLYNNPAQKRKAAEEEEGGWMMERFCWKA